MIMYYYLIHNKGEMCFSELQEYFQLKRKCYKRLTLCANL